MEEIKRGFDLFDDGKICGGHVLEVSDILVENERLKAELDELKAVKEKLESTIASDDMVEVTVMGDPVPRFIPIRRFHRRIGKTSYYFSFDGIM